MQSKKFVAGILGFLVMTSGYNAYAGCEDRGGSESDCSATTIHPDCTDNARPKMCTVMVNKMTNELAQLRSAFAALNVNQIASFFHPQCMLNVSGQYLRGRQEVINNSLTPFISISAAIDFGASAYRFQVVNQDTIVTYGDIPSTVTLKDGSVLSVVVRQVVTWTRQDGGSGSSSLPFLVAGDYEQNL